MDERLSTDSLSEAGLGGPSAPPGWGSAEGVFGVHIA